MCFGSIAMAVLFIILKYIDRGTFSRVWLTYDLNNKKFVVFKSYPSENKSEFKYELETYSKLDSENIQKVIKFDSFLITKFDIDSYNFHNTCNLQENGQIVL